MEINFINWCIVLTQKLKKGRKKFQKLKTQKKVPDVFKNANRGMDDINRQLARSGVSDNLNKSY